MMMMDEKQPATTPHAGPFWPWFVGGLLSPVAARLLTGPIPAYLAAGLSFFVFFAAASYLVSKNFGMHKRRLARNLLASAGGGVIAAALTYAFR